jgi:long-chain-fatty-acid--CoA ligase ACSBG
MDNNSTEYILILSIIILIIYLIYNYYINKKKINKKEILYIANPNNKTIIDSLNWASKICPDNNALMIRKDNDWEGITYKQYYSNVKKFGKSLNYWFKDNINIGIFGFNSPAWFYSYLGCLMNGGISVAINLNNSLKECEYIIKKSNITVIVVENDNQLQKLLDIDLSTIKLILYYSPISEKIIKKFDIPIISFGVFLNNNKINDTIKLKKINENNNATTIYKNKNNKINTINLTHNDILKSITSMLKTIQNNSEMKLYLGERFISYLPLDNITTQLMDIYLPISILGTVWFADKNASKNTIIKTIRYSQPTIFMGTPYIWEKIKNKLEKEKNNYLIKNIPNIVIRNKIIKKIGFDKCKWPINTFAPLSNDTLNYFYTLNFPLHNMYSLNKTCGPITVSLPGLNNKKTGSIPILGTEIKIDNDGEIIVKSIKLNNKWIKTGDYGYIENNLLYITGKKKDIIITCEGNKISPSYIENKIIELIPEIKYAVLIGDNKKYITLLLIPKIKNKNRYDIFKSIDKNINSFNDIENSSDIKNYIDDKINIINKKYTNDTSNIKKWIFINNNLNVGQELSPTLKFRRKFINNKYKNIIKPLYKTL